MGALARAADSAPPLPPGRSRRPLRFGLGLLFLLLAVFGLPPLLSWQQGSQRQMQSQTNLRRLAAAALFYAQDWDGRLMPPAQRRPDGFWQTWPATLRPYADPASVFINPANPIEENSPPRDPEHGYPVHTSYALNGRFYDTFAPGPFPLENLELPEQTVLFVEAGPMWRDPRKPPYRKTDRSAFAMLIYGDTLDRVDGFCPYPSPHAGKMVVVAADGHTEVIDIEHYTREDGAHDRLYGRLGKDLYNWNGGHPNGETDRPPRE